PACPPPITITSKSCMAHALRPGMRFCQAVSPFRIHVKHFRRASGQRETRPPSPVSRESLADTEFREDDAEHLLNIDHAGNLANRDAGAAKLLSPDPQGGPSRKRIIQPC